MALKGPPVAGDALEGDAAVLIKSADDKQPDIDALTALAARRDVNSWTRREIHEELARIRAGIRGERDAAYEINERYATNPNHATIHDLRIEANGHVAQIDHLIINRLLQIWVCESKHFAEGVVINEQGEWERLDRGGAHGMASPVAQNARHIAVLEEVCRSGRVELPKRTGYVVKPEFRSLILISTGARIRRRRRPVDGIETVIKADQLPATIDRQMEQQGVFGLLGKAAIRLISPDQLEAFVRQLASLHSAAPRDWAARFGLAPSSSPVAASSSGPDLNQATTSSGAREFMSSSRAPAPVADDRLLVRLKTWRLDRARRDGVPAYAIAEDRTLLAIATVRPTSLGALARVNGIGPARLERYGQEILRVVEGVA